MSGITSNRYLVYLVAIALVGFFSWLQISKSPVQLPSVSTFQKTDTIYDPARITKKPFGIYISPGHSPVSPERFTGFHTGVDFETTAAEADAVLQIPAFCDGKLLLKKWVSGYGGAAVQSCTLNQQAVTVVYGHLNIDSVRVSVGQVLKKGDLIGSLGQGYSTQTDGERKHLHFGIHKGTSVNILGYAPSSEELSQWLDPAQFLK